MYCHVPFPLLNLHLFVCDCVLIYILCMIKPPQCFVPSLSSIFSPPSFISSPHATPVHSASFHVSPLRCTQCSLPFNNKDRSLVFRCAVFLILFDKERRLGIVVRCHLTLFRRRSNQINIGTRIEPSGALIFENITRN